MIDEFMSELCKDIPVDSQTSPRCPIARNLHSHEDHVGASICHGWLGHRLFCRLHPFAVCTHV